MDIKKAKEIFKYIFSKKFLLQIGIAFGVIIALGVVVLLWIRIYTNHGEAVEVPNLKGMKTEQVGAILEDMQLRYELVDSVYNPKAEPGTVIEQIPGAGEMIKRNRTIYISINAVNKPMIAVPDVTNMSNRNAQATLESMGFKVVGIQRVNSEYSDLALGVKTSVGQNLNSGSKLPVGSSVILIVGYSTAGDSTGVDSETEVQLEEEVPTQSTNVPVKRPIRQREDIEEFF